MGSRTQAENAPALRLERGLWLVSQRSGAP
jgi:hypothetical protein